MISSIEIKHDLATFPVVSWTETRGIFGAAENGGARVECRIMKHADGELMFVAKGSKRKGFGVYEDGRPWRLLKGIGIVAADSLYRSANERHVLERIMGKSLAARMTLQEGAHVLVAEFHGGAPIYINETSAPMASLNQLHAMLLREFIDNRRTLLAHPSIEEEFKWPINDQRVETYDASRSAAAPLQKKMISIADKAFAGVLLATIVAVVVWVAMRLFR